MTLKMGFKGFTHPMTQEEVVPTMKMLVSSAIEKIQSGPEQVDREELVEFLKILLDITEPTGYFYCPYDFSFEQASL